MAAGPEIEGGRTIDVLRRQLAAAKTERDEALASQAVIAMENARLINETREALEQQTATTEVLEVINSSPGELAPVFDTMLERAMRLCSARFGMFMRFDGQATFDMASDRGVPPQIVQMAGQIESPPPHSGLGQLIAGEQVVQIVDLPNTDLYRSGYIGTVALVEAGAKTAIFVALRRDERLMGAIIIYRGEATPFSDKQVALLQNFAAQAVIAMENVRLLTEQREALEQQTATAEILGVISQSPTDVAPVLTAMARAARRVCGSDDAVIVLRQGEETIISAYASAEEGARPATIGLRRPLDRSNLTGRSIIDRRAIHVPDIQAADPREFADSMAMARQYGWRSAAAAPMVREGAAVGSIMVRKSQAGGFSERQIALLETFAAQAVIAIENVRLFTELGESLEQQTATTEILQVISQSPTDVKPVLDAVVKAAVRFCGVDDATIGLRDDKYWIVEAHVGPMRALVDERQELTRQTAMGRAIVDGKTVHIPDYRELDPVEFAGAHELSARVGVQAALAAPLLREGVAIGGINLRRPTRGAFTPRQIELLESFAAQAVIAIENVRLFTELKESLEYQTATSELLEVISRSASDIQPVFDTMLASAARLCGVQKGDVAIRQGDAFRHVAYLGANPEELEWLKSRITTPGRGTSTARALLERRIDHVLDQSLDPERVAPDAATAARTTLAVPLLRDGEPIGVISLLRDRVEAFTERQVTLIKTFADQAVIAMENARLLSELRERTDDLTESLEYQTATSEVLEVIGRSTSDIQPVLDTMLSAALRLCRTESGGIAIQQGEGFRYVATLGWDREADKAFRSLDITAGRGTVAARVLAEGRIVQVADVASDPEFALPDMAERAQWHTALGVPLMRGDRPIGVIAITRDRVEPFTERQISLVRTFADQAVIAMENARLLGELRQRTDDLTESLDYQTATSEVLGVISRSPTTLQPVLEAMTAAAVRLCGVKTGGLSVRRGDSLEFVALVGQTPEFERWQASTPIPVARGVPLGDAILDKAPVQIVDVMDTEAYKAGAEVERAVVELGGHRTILHVPLLRDDEAIGVLTVSRGEPLAFTERQIGLIETFADQAVIAMENARLLSELQSSLEQQTATAEILRVINTSPGDLTPVFQAILEKAHSVCGADMGSLFLRDGANFRAIKTMGYDEEIDAILRQSRPPMPPMVDIIAGQRFYHVTDLQEDESGSTSSFGPRFLAGSRIRTNLIIPLRKDDTVLGFISANRREVRPYSDKEIALLENFAAQAVIAIENARLLGELRQRTDDLTESLEYQTATSELLEVISRSGADIQPVFDALAASSVRLCGADHSIIFRFDGELLRLVTAYNTTADFRKWVEQHPIAPGRHSGAARSALERRTIHIADVHADAEYSYGARDVEAIRTILAVPILKGEELLGVFMIFHLEVKPFTDKQIRLIETFADQASIAIENARLLSELRESLDQQTATSDVLKTISRSSVALEAVLETLVETVARLCRADQGYMYRQRENQFHLLAAHGAADKALRYLGTHPFERDEGTTIGRVVARRQTTHIHDVLEDKDYTNTEGQRLAGFRTMLGIPLMAQDKMVGVFVVGRTRVDPFTEKEIALASGFADQAVIAIENARLFEELRDRQAELRVTFDNMGDGVVMFDADLRLAAWNRNFQQLLDVPDDFLASRPGLEDYVRLLVTRGELGDRDPDKEVARYRDRATRQWSAERTRPDGRVLEVRNNPVPGGGAVLIYSDITKRKQAEAEIRSARDAAEAALERQTATADILKVIANSPTDVQPVLEAVAKAAVRFCGASDAIVTLRQGDEEVPLAHEGILTASLGMRRPLTTGLLGGLSIVEGRTLQIADIDAPDAMVDPALLALAKQHKWRASVAAPMMRDGKAIGCILLRKPEPGLVSPQQIELLETFAAQAVIAIENVRLFTELRESLEQQTASAEILEVISQSPTDVAPVLTAVAKAAIRFCNSPDAVIWLRDGDEIVRVAHEGPLFTDIGARRPLSRNSAVTRAITESRTIHYQDLLALDPAQFADLQKRARERGYRASLAAPLLREGQAIGAIVLRKQEAVAYTERQIELLEAFAAQAVIAIENVRLFTELRDSLERLKAAQANLVQSEKMASLGQLTAGIAHEIKNPLNFVNNFASLSVELLDELKDVAGPALATLAEDKRAELDETMSLLIGNLAKITEHGKRADGIVKSMLSHSRGGAGDWLPSDINALVEEALNLAYHGARAQDKEFNVTLERDFEKTGKPIDVVPQDVTRVFLNLFGNGFYAANKRRLGAREPGFRPTIKVATRDLGDRVEVRVRDNGIGISPEVREKLFQPFFTTKPTGEGTGLGLSISYDIVTQQHGGTIEVESEPGLFTEFTVRLPRSRRAVSND
jgi:GAF domain-containing protein/two-component sensor histidine kinase